MLNRHDQSPSARQRIPVNREFTSVERGLVLANAILTLLFLAAPPAHARIGASVGPLADLAEAVETRSVVLPFYNGTEQYRTTLGAINPTSDPCTIPAPFRPVVVGAFETKVLTTGDGFLAVGGGMQELTIPAALRVRVEVTDPAGTRIRISPLAPYEDAVQVQDLGLNGYLWVGSFGYAYLSIEWFRNAESLGAPVHVDLNGWLSKFGHVDLIAAPPGANRAVIRRRLIPRQQPFYVFGYDKSGNGEIDSISYATPLP